MRPSHSTIIENPLGTEIFVVFKDFADKLLQSAESCGINKKSLARLEHIIADTKMSKECKRYLSLSNGNLVEYSDLQSFRTEFLSKWMRRQIQGEDMGTPLILSKKNLSFYVTRFACG